MSDFVDLSNARPGTKYEETIKGIKKDDVCPFCPEHLAKYHKNPIIKETANWIMTDNMYPYKPVKNHVLFIHKAHITHANQITKEGWAELQDLTNWLYEDRKMIQGSLIMRFGQTKNTGASVSHLHAHILESNPDDPDYNKKQEWFGLVARVG